MSNHSTEALLDANNKPVTVRDKVFCYKWRIESLELFEKVWLRSFLSGCVEHLFTRVLKLGDDDRSAFCIINDEKAIYVVYRIHGDVKYEMGRPFHSLVSMYSEGYAGDVVRRENPDVWKLYLKGQKCSDRVLFAGECYCMEHALRFASQQSNFDIKTGYAYDYWANPDKRCYAIVDFFNLYPIMYSKHKEYSYESMRNCVTCSECKDYVDLFSD